MKVNVWNGNTKFEGTASTLVKAEALAREQMGDAPTAFAWINYGKVNYTILPGGQKMTKDECGRDSWAALEHKEGETMDQAEEIKQEGDKLAQMIAESKQNFKLLVFNYAGREYPGKPAIVSTDRKAIVLDDNFKTKEGKKLLMVVMNLRLEDPKFKAGQHEWDFRHIYPEAMTEVKMGDQITPAHPAAKVFRNLHPQADNLAKVAAH